MPSIVSQSAEGRANAFAATRFVLVEPSHPGNVGASARALKTMGFATLVLVRPRAQRVREDVAALAMASAADDVLRQAQVVDSLDQALRGVHWSLALSARAREYGPPALEPRAAAATARQLARYGSLALVFGNERTGLTNAEGEQCSAVAHIPANPVYSSLNLAQAVQVLAYELRQAYLHRPGEDERRFVSVSHSDVRVLATVDEIAGMYRHWETALTDLEFLDPAQPKKLMSRLRRLFARTGLEREEVNILRGIAKHILSSLAGSRAARLPPLSD